VTQSKVHFQGNCEWELLWTGLQEAAQDLPISNIELSVNAPIIQEGFHASWTRHAADFEHVWRCELPLMAAGHHVGHIRAIGERSRKVPAGALEKTLLLFETFEAQLEMMFVQSRNDEQATSPARPRVASPVVLAAPAETSTT
jgi:hypothetical protein